MPNVLRSRDLVSRPDNMDETVDTQVDQNDANPLPQVGYFQKNPIEGYTVLDIFVSGVCCI